MCLREKKQKQKKRIRGEREEEYPAAKMALNQDQVGDANAKDRLVVRIDQNSESDLQALFDSVLKPDGQRPLQVPLRQRNLPHSFFHPPSTGSKSPSISHSRENSADSAFGAGGALSGVVNGGGSSASSNNGSGGTTSPGAGASPAGHPELRGSHLRAHSSPASLQQTYASAQQQQQIAPQPHSARHGHHQKQRSYDVISTVDDLGPLPHGWEQARTNEGQIYFLK